MTLEANPATISVVITNQAQNAFLPECLASLIAQTLPPLEVILVDDGSLDEAAATQLGRLSAGWPLKRLVLPRQGRATARLYGTQQAQGHYVFWLEASDYLAPTALAEFYRVITTAPAQTGFVYPDVYFAGNASESQVSPEFNLYWLLQENYCPPALLLDQQLLGGLTNRPEVEAGWQEWDLLLQMVEQGYLGRCCGGELVYFRQYGSSRELFGPTLTGPDRQALKDLHPALYRPASLRQIKQKWSPALSLALDWPSDTPAKQLTNLGEGLLAQTCLDFELIAPAYLQGQLPEQLYVKYVEISEQTEQLQKLVAAARGKYCLLWPATTAEPFSDKAFVEKTLRLLENCPESEAVALLGQDRESQQRDWRELTRTELKTTDKANGLGLLLKTRTLAEGWLRAEPAANSYAGLLACLERRSRQNGRFPQWRTLKLSQLAGVNFEITATIVGQSERPLLSLAAKLDEPGQRREWEFRQNCPPIYSRTENIARWPQTAEGSDLFRERPWLSWQPEATRPLYLLYQPQTQNYQLSLDPQELAWRGYQTQATLGLVYTRQFIETRPLLRQTDPRNGSRFSYSNEAGPANGEITRLGYLPPTYLHGRLPLHQMRHSQSGQVIFGTEYENLTRQGYCSEQLLGYLEPVELELRRIEVNRPEDEQSLAAGQTWPLYEYYDPAQPDYYYSLRPDRFQSPENQPQIIGYLHSEAGLYRHPLYELYQPALRRHLYSLDPAGGQPWGFEPVGLAGYVTVNQSQPLLYHYFQSTTGAHRLVTQGPGEKSAEAASFAEVGPLWNIYATGEPAPVALYQWYNQQEGRWAYSTQVAPLVETGQWQFEGALGLLDSQKGAGKLVTLYRLRQPESGQLRYSVNSAGWQKEGYRVEQVLGYFPATPGLKACVPLFRLIEPATGRELLSLNPAKEGFASQGAIGYLEPARPGPLSTAFTAEQAGFKLVDVTTGDKCEPLMGGWLLSEARPGTRPLYRRIADNNEPEYSVALSDKTTLEGYIASELIPGGVPLYQLRDTGSLKQFCTTNPARSNQLNCVVEGVVGYLMDQPQYQPVIRKRVVAPEKPRWKNFEEAAGEVNWLQVQLAGKQERLNWLENEVLAEKNRHIQQLEQHIGQLANSKTYLLRQILGRLARRGPKG